MAMPSSAHEIVSHGALGMDATDDVVAFTHVALQGRLVAATSANASLYIFNLSGEQGPELISVISLAGMAADVSLAGTSLCVAEGDSGLEVFDLSDPASPLQTARLSVDENGEAFHADKVWLDSNSRLFSATGHRLDVIDPGSATPFPTLGHIETDYIIRDVAFDGTLLALTHRSNGVQFVDPTDPSSMQLLGEETHRSDRVLLTGTFACIGAEEFETGVFRTVDYSVDPPVEIGRDETYAGYDGSISYPAVTLAGRTACLPFSWDYGDGTNAYGIFVYDVSDSTDPQQVTTLHLDIAPTDGCGDDTLLAVTTGDLLRLYSLADPAQPEEIFLFSSSVPERGTAPRPPRSPRLSAVYPNPFNASTRIEITLPHKTTAQVTVTDLLGRQVAMLYQGSLTVGVHSFTLAAVNWPSGTYIVRLQTETGQEARKVYLLK